MASIHLAAMLIAASAALAQAQASPPAAAIQPSVDSAEERQTLRELSACLADARPGWARRTLSHPYLSDAQAREAAQALSGSDRCLLADEVEVTFRTSGLIGGMAEHFVRGARDRTDLSRLAGALQTMEPLNASEDFALCVAARNPEAALHFSLSEPGSAAEQDTARQLSAGVASCTRPGERLTIDLQALRALVSTALYRSISAVQAAGG